METSYLKVDSNPSLVRDIETGAILNINTTELDDFNRKRMNNLKMRSQIEEQARQIVDIKSDVSEIKSMLIQLLSERK
jgi:hypothetical protein